MKRTYGASGFTLVEIMIVVAIIGILIAIAVPGFIRARSHSRMRACQENLTKIDGAKEQYALAANLPYGQAVSFDELVDIGGTGYLRNTPREPSGGSYAVNAVGTDPTCGTNYPGHSMIEIGMVVTAVEGGS